MPSRPGLETNERERPLLAVAIAVVGYVLLQVLLTVRLGLQVTPDNPRGLHRNKLLACMLLPPAALFLVLEVFAFFLYRGYCSGGLRAMSYACGRAEYMLGTLVWVGPLVSVPALAGWLLCGVAIGYAAWVRKA
jgi:hypothetical protein